MSVTIDGFTINFETGIPASEKVVTINRTNKLTNCNFGINFETGIPASEKVVTILRGSVIPPELLPSGSEISSISQGTYRFDLCRGSFLFE